MMNKVGTKKPRKIGPTIEALENRNLLTVSPVHGIRSSVIQAVLKPITETASWRNHTPAVGDLTRANPHINTQYDVAIHFSYVGSRR